MFRLTQDERLDGHTDCTLWTPFAKMHVVGQLFISNNYICFNSKEEDLCQLIIPLREVSKQLENWGQCSGVDGAVQGTMERFQPISESIS